MNGKLAITLLLPFSRLNEAAMRRIPLLALSATAVLAAGCMTGPDYARPDVKTPEQWATELRNTETGAPVPPVEWWTTLNDPVLNGLVERSAVSNLNLGIAEARLREARAARGIASAALWPTLNVAGGYSRNQRPNTEVPSVGPGVSVGGTAGPTGFTPSVTVRGNNFSATRSGIGNNAVTSVAVTPNLGGDGMPGRQTDLFQVGFDSAWELDVFGGTRRAIEAADASVEATLEGKRDVLVSLISEVALNYIELRTAQGRLAITQKNIEAQRESYRIARERYDAGLATALDPARAEAQLKRTESQVPLLQTQIDTAIHRLGVLMGETPGALMTELTPPADLPTPPDAVPVGLPSDLLRRRPDIRRAERELAAATANIGVAVADLYPRFALTGNIAGQSNLLSSILNNSNQVWSIGPSVRWPIFQGGRILSNIEVQNARQEQAALAYQQTILLAFADVEGGLVSFAKEQERRESLRASVAANRTAVDLANSRYISGLEDFLVVLQAQQELFSSEDLLIQSEGFVLTDLVSLYKALGGGWEVREPQAEETSPVQETAQQ